MQLRTNQEHFEAETLAQNKNIERQADFPDSYKKECTLQEDTRQFVQKIHPNTLLMYALLTLYFREIGEKDPQP